MAAQGLRGVARILKKLEKSVNEGNYYEAHQMYRTLYFRYLGQNRYEDLKYMLYNGSISFLEHDQQLSGADLAILLIEVLVKSKESDAFTWVLKISKIFRKISPSTPERDTFLAHAMRWVEDLEDKECCFFLHETIALIYWREKNYIQARHHYVHSHDFENYAKFLIEYQSTQGYKCEVDLFIAQAVLQCLVIKNNWTAYKTFMNYTEHHPRIKRSGPPYLLPLLNFIWFLLQAVESQKLQTFAVLCEQYEPSIKRDPSYVQYLDKIGQLFFGLEPPRQQRGGLLGNFLESFLSGLDDDSDNEAPRPSTSSSSSKRPMLENTDLD